MKNISTFLLVLTALFWLSSSSFADDETVVNEVMQIRYASDAPVIDGIMDDIWLTTTAEQMFHVEGDATGSAIFAYDDHYSAFRVLWDEDYFYIFMSVVDDTLKTEIDEGSPWLNDCIELFIDGGNEKSTAGYDANDVQWRWVYPETVDGEHPATSATNSPGEWAWMETSSGYNFELRISADSLSSRFALEEDTEIGFEISNGDLETSASPQTVLHWWTSVATTWNDPSLFGTAVLTGKEISPILEIPYAEDKPVIDGEMNDDEGWELTDEISLTRFEGASDVNPQAGYFIDWTDHVGSFWTLWDEEYLYFFARVIDDSLKTDIDEGSPWLNDCIEIFFDGGNEKSTSGYDANDVQWRWVYPEPSDGEHPATSATNSPGDWAWAETELGYDFELRISADSLASRFALESDTEIGFEVSNGDLETASSPQYVLHWWTNVATTWNDPSLFGTALLTGGSVGVDDKLPVAGSYALSQNYPNPFNPSTTITYSVANSDRVKLSVYNVLGNQVAVLVDNFKGPGTYNVKFNAGDIASGVYFYKLEAGNQLLVKKMMLLK